MPAEEKENIREKGWWLLLSGSTCVMVWGDICDLEFRLLECLSIAT